MYMIIGMREGIQKVSLEWSYSFSESSRMLVEVERAEEIDIFFETM